MSLLTLFARRKKSQSIPRIVALSVKFVNILKQILRVTVSESVFVYSEELMFVVSPKQFIITPEICFSEMKANRMLQYNTTHQQLEFKS